MVAILLAAFTPAIDNRCPRLLTQQPPLSFAESPI